VTVEKEDINLKGYSFRSRQAEFYFCLISLVYRPFHLFFGGETCLYWVHLGLHTYIHIYGSTGVCTRSCLLFLTLLVAFLLFFFFLIYILRVCVRNLLVGVGGLDCVGGVSERLWLNDDNV